MQISIDKDEKFYLHNNKIIESKNQSLTIPEDVKVFYEVIRVINGKPLFLKEHLERLRQSTRLSRIEAIDIETTEKKIFELLKTQFVKEKNLKITFYCSDDCLANSNLFAYFVESNYPNEVFYKHGVKVELLSHKRNNPNVKLENPSLRGSADKVICLSQTHEVLLVNDNSFITEGSRSNFFAVYGNTLVTPPANDVLKGVTRQVIVKLAQENKIRCYERPIHSSEIYRMDGAFITGTSSKVLPIKKVGEYEFDSIPETTRLMMKFYDDLLESIIR